MLFAASINNFDTAPSKSKSFIGKQHDEEHASSKSNQLLLGTLHSRGINQRWNELQGERCGLLISLWELVRCRSCEDNRAKLPWVRAQRRRAGRSGEDEEDARCYCNNNIDTYPAPLLSSISHFPAPPQWWGANNLAVLYTQHWLCCVQHFNNKKIQMFPPQTTSQLFLPIFPFVQFPPKASELPQLLPVGWAMCCGPSFHLKISEASMSPSMQQQLSQEALAPSW